MSQSQNQDDYKASTPAASCKAQSTEAKNELEPDLTPMTDKRTLVDANRSCSVESTNGCTANLSHSSDGSISGNNTSTGSAGQNDSVTSNMIVNTLMSHQQSGEEGFNRRAIESLVKKLREKKDELQYLVLAVTSGGSHPGGCVCISRTLDGRLQVAGKKGFPHVIFARIWRWKDLHKNELRAVPMCKFAFDMKLDSVCVNPYHYERVIQPTLTPSSWKHYSGIGSHSSMRMMNTSNMPFSGPPNPSVFQYSSSTGLVPARYNHMYSSFSEGAISSYQSMDNSWMESNSGDCAPGPPYMGSEYPPRDFIDMPIQSKPPTQYSASISGFPHEGSYRDHPHNQNLMNGMIVSQSNLQNVDPSFGGQFFGGVLKNPGIPAIALRNPSLEHWCSICYYESQDQIGDPFYVPLSVISVSVDGFTDASGSGGSRFCLGQVNNIRRTSESERALMHVGRGVNIHSCVDGDVWLQCVSEQSVFVESYFLDTQAGRTPGTVVHKIYPCAYIKVFDLKLCNSLIRHHISANSSTTMGSIGQLNDLQKLCHLRLSFVKGWGPDYPRTNIEDTPCWIEIRFNHALRLLDDILSTLSSTKSSQSDSTNTGSGAGSNLERHGSIRSGTKFSDSSLHGSLGSNSSLGSANSSCSQNVLSSNTSLSCVKTERAIDELDLKENFRNISSSSCSSPSISKFDNNSKSLLCVAPLQKLQSNYTYPS